MKKLSNLESKEAEAGYDDAQHPTADMSYAELAWVHERGKGIIPPRAFMTQAFHNMLGSEEIYEQAIKNALYGTSNTDRELKKIATKLSKAISDSIKRGDFQPLSEITISMKGHSTILRDTDSLMNNVMKDVVLKGVDDYGS